MDEGPQEVWVLDLSAHGKQDRETAAANTSKSEGLNSATRQGTVVPKGGDLHSRPTLWFLDPERWS